MEWEPRKPTVSKDESTMFAEHILNCTGGYIKDVLLDYDKEVRCLPEQSTSRVVQYFYMGCLMLGCYMPMLFSFALCMSF